MNFRAYLNDFRFCHVSSSSEAKDRVRETINLAKVCGNCEIGVLMDKNPFLICWKSGNLSSLISTDKELKNSLVSILQKNIILDCQRDKETYYTIEESKDGFIQRHNVSDSIMAHAYESDSSDQKSILLNLDMLIPNPTVCILKNDSSPKNIYSFSTQDRIVAFLQEKKKLKRYYDTKCSYVPNDSETILSDQNLFTPTDSFNKGARLYERNDNRDELWCRDTKHFGTSVHLEVFSRSNSKQIHVSKHDEIKFFRELTKEESNRTIKP